MSAEFDALMASTQLEREKADGIKSLVAASKLAAKWQHRAEQAEATIERVRVMAESWGGFGDKNGFRSTMVFAAKELRTALKPTDQTKGKP